MAEHALRTQVEYRMVAPQPSQGLMSLRVHNHVVKKDKNGAEDAKLSNLLEHIIAKSARGTTKWPVSWKMSFSNAFTADVSRKWIIIVLGLSIASLTVPFLTSSAFSSTQSHQ